MPDKFFSIGVNAYEANVPKRVGSNLYAYKLLCELESQTREATEKVGPVEVAKKQDIQWFVYLPSPPLIDLPKERPGWKYVVIPPAKFWTQWRLPLALFVNTVKHDVFLSLGHYAPRFCPVPSCICILDLAFLKFPQFFLKKDLYQLREWTRYSANSAKHIFTISQSSKKDILETYKKQESDVSIVYPGLETGFVDNQTLDPFGQESERLFAKFGIKKGQYLVSIGTIQPRKNIISSIHAFEKLNPEHQNAFKLVLIGKAGWLTDEFNKALSDSPQKDNIVCTGFVEDKEKYLLLKYARASFLVGYYEGFGIPAVESLQVGVTPVVANTASLPEVVGEFGVLIDPYSVDSIADGFTKALNNPPDTMRRMAMMEWAKKFSWETSAKAMLETLVEKFKAKG